MTGAGHGRAQCVVDGRGPPRGAIRQLGVLEADHRGGDLVVHQLGHHLQTHRHRHRQQPLTGHTGDVGQRHPHLIGQLGQLGRGVAVDDADIGPGEAPAAWIEARTFVRWTSMAFAHSADDGPWCRDTRASSIAVRMQCGSIAVPQVRTPANPGRVDASCGADRAHPRAPLRGRRTSRWHDVAAVRTPLRLLRVCGPRTRHRSSDPCSEWIEPADRVAVARAQDPASYPTLRPSRHRPAGQDVRQALRLRADRTCPRGAWTFSRPCRTCGHMSCVPVGVLPAAGWVSAWRSGQPAARRASANAARLLRTTRPGASSTCHARPRVSCRVRK